MGWEQCPSKRGFHSQTDKGGGRRLKKFWKVLQDLCTAPWVVATIKKDTVRRNKKNFPIYISSPRWPSLGRKHSVSRPDRSTRICVPSDLHHVQSAGENSGGKLPFQIKETESQNNRRIEESYCWLPEIPQQRIFQWEHYPQRSHQKFHIRSTKTKNVFPKWDSTMILTSSTNPNKKSYQRQSSSFFLGDYGFSHQIVRSSCSKLCRVEISGQLQFAVLGTVPVFQPKNKRQAFMKIPALGLLVRDMDGDKMVCPARTLKSTRPEQT